MASKLLLFPGMTYQYYRLASYWSKHNLKVDLSVLSPTRGLSHAHSGGHDNGFLPNTVQHRPASSPSHVHLLVHVRSDLVRRLRFQLSFVPIYAHLLRQNRFRSATGRAELQLGATVLYRAWRATERQGMHFIY